MITFTSLFDTILIADEAASREAARKVRKFLYSSRNGADDYDDLKNIIDNAPKKYLEIFEDWRQENFVMAISVMYFLHDKESRPDFLFPWLIQLLYHKNGYIRLAASRMIENELGPLTVHLRFPGEESTTRDISPQQADDIIFKLFGALNSVSHGFWKPAYKKYKYIDALPSGTYKSVQMILSTLEEYCGNEYMRRLKEL